MAEIRGELLRMVEEAMAELALRDSPELRTYAAKIRGQHERTHEEVDRIEFLLGRLLTRGEVYWIHRRLHYGLQVPADAELDYDTEALDAAYRERLARSDGEWRGPLDDIPGWLRDLFPG